MTLLPAYQPDAEAVVHQHLHPVGTAVGEKVGMVRTRRTEDIDDPGQRRLGAGAHVQRVRRQPDGIDADHRSNSRIQLAHSASAAIGQATVIVVGPRRSSTRMSPTGGAGACICTATNAAGDGAGSEVERALDRKYLGVANPAAKQICVDAARHRHGRQRHAWLCRGSDGVGLELIAVQAPTPPAGRVLGTDSVHVSTKSLKWTRASFAPNPISRWVRRTHTSIQHT